MACRSGRYRRADRLRRAAQFARVMRTGRRAAGAGFVLVVAESEPREPVGPPRLGITVSRKVGSAVVRNRVKRQVREWFRGHRSGLARGLDVVVIGRAPAAGLPHRAVDAELCELVRKLSAEGVRG